MTSPSAESRAVTEVRIPAVDLRPGDLVNLSPGEDDWQEVTGVYLTPNDAAEDNEELRTLLSAVTGRYVVVRLTDLAPVDNTIVFAHGEAYVESADGESADELVTDVASSEDGHRTYLYTKYELVTVRA